MIGKLKRRFIILATISVFALMAVLLLIINLVNYSAVVADSDTVLDVLGQPKSPFQDGITPVVPGNRTDFFIPHGMSPEVPYESRYFSVKVNASGEVKESDLSRIISVDSDSAKAYIQQAVASSEDRGFIGNFRYLKIQDEPFTRILFLDCGRKLDAFKRFILISLIVGFSGCVLVSIIFIIVSGRIVKPIAESYEKQKKFISNAGHEIKTPLTIINANVDLLETDGEKEELTEIRTQAKRLTELTNNLVSLSKMEEEHPLEKVPMPLSDLVAETANSFRTPMTAKNISFSVTVQPDISMNGSPDAIRQLVSLLLENAVKYGPNGGAASLRLSAGKRAAELVVFNTTKDRVEKENLEHVFDRFYRADASRNSQTGGHGIGLSIAKAIVEQHGGRISAGTQNGFDFSISIVLPL